MMMASVQEQFPSTVHHRQIIYCTIRPIAAILGVIALWLVDCPRVSVRNIFLIYLSDYFMVLCCCSSPTAIHPAGLIVTEFSNGSAYGLTSLVAAWTTHHASKPAAVLLLIAALVRFALFFMGLVDMHPYRVATRAAQDAEAAETQPASPPPYQEPVQQNAK